MPRFDDYDDLDIRRQDFMDDRYRSDPHSGPGIASFIFAVLAMLLAAGFVLLVLDINPDNFERAMQNKDPQAITAVFLFLGTGGSIFMGLVLGIIGVSQQHRNKVFAIIGLVLHGLFLFCGCGLMLIGAVAG